MTHKPSGLRAVGSQSQNFLVFATRDGDWGALGVFSRRGHGGGRKEGLLRTESWPRHARQRPRGCFSNERGPFPKENRSGEPQREHVPPSPSEMPRVLCPEDAPRGIPLSGRVSPPRKVPAARPDQRPRLRGQAAVQRPREAALHLRPRVHDPRGAGRGGGAVPGPRLVSAAGLQGAAGYV